MNLYRTEDIQAITDKFDQITESSLDCRNKLLEPSLDEYLEIMEVIKGFIKSKKRIVYGGQALHNLIRSKDSKSGVYTSRDRKDIEFYTPEPIHDVVELANLLHNKGFKWVQGTQAFHDETYKIFVNFEEYCDMTYMPRNIYSNMPVVKLDGMLYTDPTWIIVDILRQYNDPVLSYWRLKDKTFFRANILMKYFPFEFATKDKFTPNTSLLEYKQQLFNELCNIDTIIFTGSVAEKFYLTRSSDVDFSRMELYSVNFAEDIKQINELIKTILGSAYDKIVINMYKPFFQFRDEHVEFLLEKECIIKISSNYGICIPYNNLYVNNTHINSVQVGGFYKEQKGSATEEKVIKVATFILLFNHILIKRQYEYVNRRENYKKYEHILSELIKVRTAYFKKKTLNVMDNSPYKEFIMRCSGKTVDGVRQFRLNLQEKKEKRKQGMFRYDPSCQQEDFKFPDFTFKNTSGNLSKGEISKVFK